MGQKQLKMDQMSTTSDDIYRVAETKDQFYQIFVPAGNDDRLVYLETLTLQLFFGLEGDAAIDPRKNYSTIFLIKPGPDKERFQLFNYVVPENGPFIDYQSGKSTFEIKLNASRDFDLVYIKTKNGEPWNPSDTLANVSISIIKDGVTLMWRPTNKANPIPAERVIIGKTGSPPDRTPFLLKLIPQNIHICPPIAIAETKLIIP